MAVWVVDIYLLSSSYWHLESGENLHVGINSQVKKMASAFQTQGRQLCCRGMLGGCLQ